MKRYALCAMLVCLSGCAKDAATTPTAAVLKSQSEAAPGPVVEEYDYSCDGRDREVLARVGAMLHPNGILALSNRRFAFLQDTVAGYDIFDNPENWCLGRSGRDGNVTHITTVR